MMMLFLIAHIYLITTGATLTSHLKAMISGWEEVH
jgi:thiosulfate reductase cytochrome b subunit